MVLVTRKAFSPCDVGDAAGAAHAADDLDREYVPAPHRDGDERAHHAHACGCSALHHDARTLDLLDLPLWEGLDQFVS